MRAVTASCFVVVTVALAACKPDASPATGAQTPVKAVSVASPPRFEDYPAKAPYAGPAPALTYTFEDDMGYGDDLRHEATLGPSFGGRFRAVDYPCGTGCRGAFIIDLATGRVYDGPANVQFMPTSRLLISYPPEQAVEEGMTCVHPRYMTRYYEATSEGIVLRDSLSAMQIAARLPGGRVCTDADFQARNEPDELRAEPDLTEGGLQRSGNPAADAVIANYEMTIYDFEFKKSYDHPRVAPFTMSLVVNGVEDASWFGRNQYAVTGNGRIEAGGRWCPYDLLDGFTKPAEPNGQAGKLKFIMRPLGGADCGDTMELNFDLDVSAGYQGATGRVWGVNGTGRNMMGYSGTVRLLNLGTAPTSAQDGLE